MTGRPRLILEITSTSPQPARALKATRASLLSSLGQRNGEQRKGAEAENLMGRCADSKLARSAGNNLATTIEHCGVGSTVQRWGCRRARDTGHIYKMKPK